ncbi:hypothetical protein [Methylomonas koyamae]|uniref:hypothetical protein n=1 Tax=Methylomonas koyamae TaxID=702114 RepID=UPI000BC2D56C|nr:hypothetical protein [Methylomonas koyamae]ATG92567.1 hypothetical protein MKLM6_4409 [Methylomonas koyamae]
MTGNLSTNILNEAVSSLALVMENLELVEKDVYRWKWVVIALHNSMQNIMVSALKQGNGFHSMEHESYKKWIEAYRNSQPLPPTKLARFLELYKRIKKKKVMECYLGSKAFVAKQEHTESVKKLNNIRNRFVHFELDVWSLETTGMPKLCLHCMDVVRFLVFDSGNILISEEAESVILRNAVSQTIRLFEQLDSQLKSS